MSKFLFSIYESTVDKLKIYCDNGDGFINYVFGGFYYLSDYKKVYSLESGLNENVINDPNIW